MGTKVIYAVTIAESLVFLKGQLKYLEGRGYEAAAVCSDGPYTDEFEQQEGTRVMRLGMERDISLKKDLKSLVECIRMIRRERPDIVNASTPKAGLIVTLAAYLCGVPIRIYTMRGLRMETTSGIKRRILLTAEKIAAGAATHCLAISESLKDQVVDFRIASSDKVSVLGRGSGDGFDVSRFHESSELLRKVEDLKNKYGISKDSFVLGFTGRLTKDKGIVELVQSFNKLKASYGNLKLLIVGEYDQTDPVPEEARNEIESNPDIIHAGFQRDPIPYFHLMDVFVFLTKREGFGNVSIEAALSGVPVVVSGVTGARDTIVDGKSGFLVDPENEKDIREKLELLILAPELRGRMGEFGRKWAEENFSNETIWQELDQYYHSCIAENMRPARQGF
ncbi:glycosyltransferase family 4 protein [Planococcus chinensis]|uniref:Glycosyltransferase family 4 protein n=1 Tax=Planococcus chinensis TaxID=272917 RepID=A0ABW4QEW1_9BACL